MSRASGIVAARLHAANWSDELIAQLRKEARSEVEG
jgi:hypothetical protein